MTNSHTGSLRLTTDVLTWQNLPKLVISSLNTTFAKNGLLLAVGVIHSLMGSKLEEKPTTILRPDFFSFRNP